MKIVFMGTPEFAVPSLRMLLQEGYEVAAVITQPDKPKGRGKKLAAPAVKEFALQHGLKVLQPEKVRTPEFLKSLEELAPDLLITAAYGRILPKAVLDVPAYGCINVHGSLLPKYRGAAPIQWSIVNGEKVTGVTTMYTDVGMDTGDILLKRDIAITDNMTGGELHDIMAEVGAGVLKDTLKLLEKGQLVRTPQDDSQATYTAMLNKESGRIDWSKSAADVHNLVRGMNPWPVAYTFYCGERMKVWSTEVYDAEGVHGVPGKILEVNSEGIDIAAAKGIVRIKELQFDSCRRMAVGNYICGHCINEGEILG